MTSLSPNCKLEKGEISDDAEENHYDHNSGGHSSPPFGGGLRSAVLTRPLAPSRGCASLPSFVVSHNYGRASGADDRCGGLRSSSHIDHCSRFHRSHSGHFSLENESSTVSSSHGRFQPPSLQRLRPYRSPLTPTSHSGSMRKNRILRRLMVMVMVR
ncbi:hypothetical protein MRX96_058539 [Rhipicephalus microplus]